MRSGWNSLFQTVSVSPLPPPSPPPSSSSPPHPTATTAAAAREASTAAYRLFTALLLLLEAVVGERHLDRLVRVGIEPAVRLDGLLEREVPDRQAVDAQGARGQQVHDRPHHARAVPRGVGAVRRAPGAHARDHVEPVVVPLLAEPQLGRAALVEADGDDRAAEPGGGDRVVQAGGGAGRLDRHVGAAGGALDRAPAVARRVEGLVGAELERELAARSPPGRRR